VSDQAGNGPAEVPASFFPVLRHFTGPGGSVTIGALESLKASADEARFLSPELLRVALVGQFKAGKSTLLNALLGAHVAPVGVFRMTAWIARYWPSETSFCRVVGRDGGAREMAVEDFIALCEGPGLDEVTAAGIDRVDIGLAGAPGLALVDCPGLGSSSAADEARLYQAIRDADAMLWVCDATVLGAEREAALIRTVQSIGIPLLVALNKCDLLDSDDESSDIVEWLRATFSLKSEPVFAISAVGPPAHTESEGGIPGHLGVAQLKTYLETAIAPRQEELRLDALNKHSAALMRGVAQVTAAAQASLLRVAEEEHHVRGSLATAKAAVQSEIRGRLDTELREGVFGERLSALIDRVVELKGGAGEVRDGDVRNAITSVYGRPDHIETAVAEGLQRISESVGAMWTKRFADAVTESDGLRSAVRAEVQPTNPIQLDSAVFEHIARSEFHAETGVVAMGAGMLLFFFPLTALLGGLGLIAAARTRRNKRIQDAVGRDRAQVEEVLDGIFDQVLSTCKREVLPRLDAVNDRIERASLVVARERICQQAGLLSEITLEELEERLRGLGAELLPHLPDGVSFPLVETGRLFDGLRRTRHRPESWSSLVLEAQTLAELQVVAKIVSEGNVDSSGILLVGPPGTGKTTIARALANEASCSFHLLSPDVVSKYFGETERNIRDLFARARANEPAIVFIDEVDSIAGRRDTDPHGYRRAFVTQVLQELDGFGAAGRVLVVGATNDEEGVDPAVRSRLGRRIVIGLPSRPSRRQLLAQFVGSELPVGELERLAAASEGLSGRDLKAVCDEAVVIAQAEGAAVPSADHYTEALARALDRPRG
jgi:GTPase SAR1 family protein